MFGLPLAAVTAVFVFLAGKVLTRSVFAMSPDIAAEIGRERLLEGRAADREGALLEPVGTALPGHAHAPGVGLVVTLIALPILLILAGTVASLTLEPQSALRAVLTFFGIPYVALLIDVLLCAWLLGVRRGAALATVSEVLGSALPGVAVIILITGAGGAFASVLVSTGIGPALAKLLQSSGLPIVIMGFLVTMLLRGAQGPTTVALMTTAGIIAPMVENAALNPNQLALVALAMGAGGMALSHVNDPGFWIVTRMSGLSVGDGLRTWTVLTTIAGFVALLLIVGLWSFV
ncbi:GntT/GntP/DsdX family permease [Rhizobium sp. RAF56]|jgi:GntP family gluconate:H+ symporter|uniref:GntT/GntP/DsdX family permease n=1 Tax=Rhizobium sp. RAF56 TaxID=3233062 RepID=UPI003F99DAA4